MSRGIKHNGKRKPNAIGEEGRGARVDRAWFLSPANQEEPSTPEPVHLLQREGEHNYTHHGWGQGRPGQYYYDDGDDGY